MRIANLLPLVRKLKGHADALVKRGLVPCAKKKRKKKKKKKKRG